MILSGRSYKEARTGAIISAVLLPPVGLGGATLAIL